MLAAIATSLMLLAWAPPSHAVGDADDTDGPLDIRSISVDQVNQGRLHLTIGFWHDFRRSAIRGIAGEATVLVRFRFPSGFNAYGYVLRRNGILRFRQGDFASSLCCWRSKLTRIGADTFSTRFLPWWVRFDIAKSVGATYQARTRICRDACLRDHAGGVIA